MAALVPGSIYRRNDNEGKVLIESATQVFTGKNRVPTGRVAAGETALVVAVLPDIPNKYNSHFNVESGYIALFLSQNRSLGWGTWNKMYWEKLI